MIINHGALEIKQFKWKENVNLVMASEFLVFHVFAEKLLIVQNNANRIIIIIIALDVISMGQMMNL